MLILYRMDFFFFFFSVFFLSFTRLPALTQFSACRITIPMCCCLCLLLLLLLLVHILSLAKLEKKIFLLSNRKVSIFHWALCSLAAFFSLLSFAPFFFAYFSSMCCFFRWWWWRWWCSCCYCCFFRALFHCKIVVQKEKWHKTSDPSEGTRPKAREQNLMLQKMCAARIMCTKSERLASYSSRHKKISFPSFLSLSRSRFVRQNVNPILSS